MMRAVLIFLFGLLLSSSVSAKEWTVDYGRSRIIFSGKQGTTEFQGGFKKFEMTINFDPANPEGGKIWAIIDTGSAYAGSAERDSALPQVDWFDTGKFPHAEFVSTSIRSDKCAASALPPKAIIKGCYIASGTLTIKDISKPVSLPFMLVEEGNNLHGKGVLDLMRNDFGVGKGQWSGEDYVKNAVTVMVDISAH